MRVSPGMARQAVAYFRDKRVKAWRKWLGVMALGYGILPIDLIPDFVPVIGWLDDLGVISAAVLFITRDIQRHAAGETPSESPFDPAESEREINPPPPKEKRSRR